MISPSPGNTPLSEAPDIAAASWQEPQRSPAARRFLQLMCLLGLLGTLALGLSFVLVAPFRHPQVHVFVLSGEMEQGLWPQKLPSARPAPAAPTLLTALQSWTETTKLPAPRSIPGLGSGQTLDVLFQLATAPVIDSGDVALCVVQSQLATIDDTVYLVDRLDPTDPLRGRIPFRKFCDALRASTARTKLLCLDAGQLSADPRSGMSVNNFEERLQKAVKEAADPDLWVLVSHGNGQISLVVEGRAPTVFLDAVVRGLQREADQNGDRRISLCELVNFVQRETAESIQGAGLSPDRQTPWLARGGGAWDEHELDLILAPVPRPSAGKSVTAAPTVAAAGSSKVHAAATHAAKVGAAVVLRPVTSMTVPELLKEAWELRDLLEHDSPSGAAANLIRPCDYAPCHWNRLMAELVQAEAIWMSQPDDFPPRIQMLLQLRTADLRTLAGQADSFGSDWLKEVRRLQPRPAGEIGGTLSLALAERWRQWTHATATEKNVAERTVLDGLLVAVDAKPLAQWVESKPSDPHAELRFALRLSSRYGLEWPQIQHALRVRCRAEEIDCRPVAIRWFAADVRSADRLRWYGERKLIHTIRPEDLATAEESLREAASAYDNIATATERVELACRLQADLLFALPHWMALARNHSLAIRPSLTRELLPLIAELGELIEILANARPDEVGRVEQLRHALHQRQGRVRALLFPEALSGQITLAEQPSGELRLLASALLLTPLPTAAERVALQHWRTASVAEDAPSIVTASHIVERIPVAVEPDRELESRYARLLQPLQQHVSKDGKQASRWKLGPALAVKETGAPSNPQAAAAQCEAAPWLQVHVAFPGELAKNLDHDAAHPKSMAAIVWGHTLRLVDPRDEIPMDVETSVSASFLEAMGSVVQWQWQQATLAQSDAPANEHVVLQARIDPLKSLLSNAFGKSAPSRSAGELHVAAPDRVDLTSVREQTISLVARNDQTRTCPVRYVVDYDASLVDIEATSDICQLTPKAPRADFRMAPYEGVSQSAATRTLPARGHDELRLKLRGNLSDGPTRLVVHVIADQSTVRKEIDIDLPRMRLGLVRAASTHNSTLAGDGQGLRPFANRATTYNLSLQAIGRGGAKLDVTAYRVTAPSVEWPPASTMPSGDMQRWLSQTTELQQLGALPNVVLAEGATVPLLFPAVKADPLVTRDLSGGLLVVLSDATRQLSTWQHIPAAPLRPPAYVEATVDYDPTRESLRIAVRPRDGLELPPDGIPVRCRIVEFPDRGRALPLRLETGRARSLDAMMQPHRRDVTLTLSYRRPAGAAYVVIDVDNWPRSFVFAVNQEGAHVATDVAVEIVEPVQRSAVRAPIDAIPATVAVTLPAPFASGTDLLEVGIDRDGDRRLDGEPTVRLTTDRQTGVVLESIDAGGTWTVRTTVRDWRVMLPAMGMSDQWGAVLARVVHGPQEAWSGGMSVAFDKGGPGLSRVAVSDDGEPTVGQPVRVTALADDYGLSGVASVSAGIDPSGLGVISPKMKLAEAAATSDGEWTVMVPTEKVPPGPAMLVIQATDFVGNVGPLKAVPIRCLTAEQAAAKLASRTAPVLGTINYSGEAVRDAEVRLTLVPAKDADPAIPPKPPLTTKTNRWGQFAFNSVPPGQYELSAKGTVRGFRYESRSPVTVAPAKELAPIKLVFGKAAK